MRYKLAALIATYVIAITSVFVIWPAVGTAPWESNRSPVCENALEIRDIIERRVAQGDSVHPDIITFANRASLVC